MDKSIAFDRSLYLPEAVEAAAAAYADHVRIALNPVGDTVVANLSDLSQEDADLIANSFCNYALQETIVRLRQAQAVKVA